MNFYLKVFSVFLVSLFVFTGGMLWAAGDQKVGIINHVDKSSGEIIVGSPSAATELQMGDQLYFRIDGKIVLLKVVFPMQTIAKCKAEGKNKVLWIKAAQGMTVYRYSKASEESSSDESTDKTAIIKPAIDPASVDVGDPVFALWTDGHFYPAKVTAVNGNLISVFYPDNYNHTVTSGGYMLNRHQYKAGDKVISMWTNLKWYPGTIGEVNGNKLFILYDDGDKLLVEHGWVVPLDIYQGRINP